MNFFRKPSRPARPAGARDRRQPRDLAWMTDCREMEPRLLMAAGPLGINLASTLGYVDLMKEAPAFSALGGGAVATDSNGWPLADAQVLVLDDRVNQPWNGPDPNAVQPDIGGTYHLSFTGQATVTGDWLNNFTVQNAAYNAATNTTTEDLVVPHNSYAMLYLDFANTVNPSSSTGAGVSNVKLIQPGYAANTTQLFTSNMINDLAPFGTIRYLNIDGANNYAPTYDANGNLIPVEWSQRKLPSAASQTSGAGQPGEAWEYMIALANATNTDMWINVPTDASDGYVASLANLIKNGDTINGVTYAGLNPNLKVYVEYGNEVWGGIYNPYAVNLAEAKQEVAAGNSTLNSDGSTDPNVWAQRYYLQRTMQITNIFRSALGSDPTYNEVRPVLGWQEQNYAYYTSTFPWFEGQYGAPDKYFYGMGYANYDSPTDYSSVSNLLSSLSSNIAAQAANEQMLATAAAYYSLNVVAYEGGPNAGGGQNAAQQQVALAAMRDPGIGAIVQQEYTSWYANGGGLAMAFDGPYDTWTPFNQYSLAELAEAANPTASAKYAGYVAVSTAPAQPDAAGTAVSATAATSIPIASDSFTLGFPTFSASQPNIWLLNVATAGNYALSIQAGAGSAIGQVTVALGDSAPIGAYSLAPSTTSSLATLSLHAGLNTLVIATSNRFNPVAMTLTPVATSGTPTLGDGSFEQESVGSGAAAYKYNPASTAWTYSGTSGVSGNGTAFTAANPAAPQGSQVAFVQDLGSITQTVAGFAAGSYHVSFQAAQRAYYAVQTLQVLVDGSVVGTFAPSSTSYQTFSTASFTVAAGSHTVTIRGTDNTSDGTDFVDGLALTADAGTNSNVITPSDAGFEQVSVGLGASAFKYDPTGSAWTFSSSAGISANGSLFTVNNYGAPQGSQVAFIQDTGSISQVVGGFAAGTYTLTFQAAQRANFATQTLQVLVDGSVVGTFAPVAGPYQTMTTSSFGVAAGSHTVTIRGTNSTADATDFVDAVSMVPATDPVLAADAGFEQEAVGTGPAAYVYDPTGSPWSYTGGAGVSGNGTAFTAANPAAPQGSQVAFLQNVGSITQTIAGFAAGSYHISFQAAQRAYYGLQTLQVLVDGSVVGTFAPTGSAYQTLTTSSFSVAAGSHTVTIRGLNTSGDATDFVDAVRVTS